MQIHIFQHLRKKSNVCQKYADTSVWIVRNAPFQSVCQREEKAYENVEIVDENEEQNPLHDCIAMLPSWSWSSIVGDKLGILHISCAVYELDTLKQLRSCDFVLSFSDKLEHTMTAETLLFDKGHTI